RTSPVAPPSVAFRAKVAAHEVGYCLTRRMSLEQNAVNHGYDRHLDALSFCQFICASGGRHPFGNCLALGKDLLQQPALSELQPHSAVTTQRAGARQYKVTHSGESCKRCRIGTERQSQSRHLRKSARNERRTGIEAGAEP